MEDTGRRYETFVVESWGRHNVTGGAETRTL